MNPSAHISEKAYRTQEKQQVRDTLILDHLGFVRNILLKTIAGLPSHVDRDNLESAGILGLVEAAEKFDPTRGVEFKSFAYLRIRGAILDELRRNSPLPQKMLQLVSQISEAIEHFGKPCLPEQIAEFCNISMDDVEAGLEAMRLRRMESWESQVVGAGPVHSRDEDPHEIVSRRDTIRVMADAISKLPDNERLAISLYYLEDLRLAEIGELMSLSESRISRLVAKAEFRLSQFVKSQTGPDS